MATRKYQKHTHHQHILELPDTYVGSTKTNEEARWVYDASANKMYLILVCIKSLMKL